MTAPRPPRGGRAEVERAILAAVAEIVPGVARADITADKHLRDLGADSVDRVEIILSVLDRLGVREPLASFSDLPNIGALTEFLYERMGK
ncbi:phosphopantetheine-binding protein [Saccharothrix coeruleofusca]|uniref:Polyketide biosynthesis acyl-carrier-protein AcpK n=1 Tax=Saccharothrix coeruleofusca TaxID=33919 RepID=A0A918AU38_9PSEU|nr:phosphopantetheine-binding protein [Saccharothrix coeruleofusca]GGP51543.1 polyketide biosynthesis acyl-carrier-protein AcpK [Saccharothrix coeruleofusca]GGP84890.1 polyketide biosynthesis acyl-carrier-protein AcpK [Saccharothrix coeruleofusca]